MSQTKTLLQYGKSVLGLALGVAAIVAAVFGRTVNGLAFDDVSPPVAAAMASVFGTVTLILWVARRVIWQLLRKRRTVRSVFREVHGSVLQKPMRKLILKMAFGITFMLPLTLLALDRLASMGTVGAIVFCGPLWLAFLGLRKVLSGARDWLSGLFWMAVAAAGVACLTRFWEAGFAGFDLAFGLAFGFGAAAAYAVFLAMYDRMRETDRHALPGAVAISNVLASAMTLTLVGGALAVLSALDMSIQGISLPGGDWMNWRVIGITALSGLFSGAVCQILQSEIFRRGLLSLGTFSVMTALEPAASFVLGTVLLSYAAVPLDGIGTLLVVVAGIACFYQWELRRKPK